MSETQLNPIRQWLKSQQDKSATVTKPRTVIEFMLRLGCSAGSATSRGAKYLGLNPQPMPLRMRAQIEDILTECSAAAVIPSFLAWQRGLVDAAARESLQKAKMSFEAAKALEHHVQFLVGVIRQEYTEYDVLTYMRDTGWRSDERGTFWALWVPNVGHIAYRWNREMDIYEVFEPLRRRLASLAGYILRGVTLEADILTLCGWEVFPGDGFDFPGDGQ